MKKFDELIARFGARYAVLAALTLGFALGAIIL